MEKIAIPNISFTLRNDLCTGCGVCEDACPSGAITTVVEAGRFVPQVDAGLCNNGKGCHRCMDACPGVGIDLCRIAKERYADEGTKEDRLVGRYLKCFVGHSTDHDIRYHSASGGMVSQFLVFLLEKGLIDGAVVTAFDPGNELLVSSYIAHNREEVLRAKGSKYAPVSLHGMARAVKADGGLRYVIVGLPCHIEGFRKLEHIDRKFREKVVGYFAVYCSSGRTLLFVGPDVPPHRARVPRARHRQGQAYLFRLPRRGVPRLDGCEATPKYQGYG